MYYKNLLLENIVKYNLIASKRKNYEVGIKRLDSKKVPYQIYMLCEDGHKHKYAGTIKECYVFLQELIILEG